MSLQKIGRQLKREFKTNPKKAVALGVLFLVAAYFWAPLILKSKAPDTPTKPSTVATQAAPAAGSVAETPNKAAPQYRWQDLDREMNRDPRITLDLEDVTARLGRNPFVNRTIVIAATEKKPEIKEDEEDEKREPAVVTPEDAGLSLSGTVIGVRRTALINGKVYAIGREVETKDGVVFIVQAVEARRVVLEREGQKFELEMSRKRSADSTVETSDTKPPSLEKVIGTLLDKDDQ